MHNSQTTDKVSPGTVEIASRVGKIWGHSSAGLAQRSGVVVTRPLPRHTAHRLVRRWLPQAEPFVLPGATHTLPMQNPRGLAEALAGFFARHPLAVPA